ncbi:MAG: hypothetical protein Q9M23_07740 [Mariprofundaceae bacterium]|nr:hypothetical protein [Mariprofundaceae bacterium]
MLILIPIGLCCLWFGWQAWKAGRQRLAIGMGLVTLSSFATAFLFYGWVWLVAQR